MDKTISSNRSRSSPAKKTQTAQQAPKAPAARSAPPPTGSGAQSGPSSHRHQRPPPLPLGAPAKEPTSPAGGAGPMRGPMAPNANPIMQPSKTTTALINHNNNNNNNNNNHHHSSSGLRAAIKLAPRPSDKQPSIHQKQSWQQQQQQQSSTPRLRQVRPQSGPNTAGFFPPPESPSLGGHCSTAMECSLTTTTTTTNTTTNSGPNLRATNEAGLLGAQDLSDCSCNSLDCLTDLSQSATSSQMDQLDGPGDVMMQQLPPSPPLLHHQHGHHHHHHHHHHGHNHPHHHPPAHHHHHHNHLHNPHHHIHVNQQMHHQSAPSQASYQHANLNHQPGLQQQQQHRPLMPYASMPPMVSSSRLGSPPGGGGGQPPPPLIRHSTYTAGSDTITDVAPHHSYQKTLSPPPPPPPPPPSVMGERPPPPPAGGGGGPLQAPQQAASDFDHPTNHHHVYGQSAHHNQDTDLNPGKHHHRTLKPAVSFRRSATTREAASGSRHRGDQQDQQLLFDYNQDQQMDQQLSMERSGYRNGTNSLQRQRSAGQQYTSQRSSSSTTPRLTHDNNRSSLTRLNANHNPCPLQPISPFSATTAATTATVSQGAPGGARNSMAHNNIPPTGLYYPSSPIQPSLTPHPNPGGQPPALTSGGLNANNRAQHLMAPSPFEGAAFCPLPAITSHRTNSPWMRISSIIATPIGIVIILFIVISPLLHYLM